MPGNSAWGRRLTAAPSLWAYQEGTEACEATVDGRNVLFSLEDTGKSQIFQEILTGPKKTVWIIGHDIVFRAGAYTASSGWGTALGLENHLNIKWMGKQGMLWDALLPTVNQKVYHLGSPDAMVIQLGENDFPGQKGVDLSITMGTDLHTLISRLPNTRLFWSDLLERRKWSGAEAPEKIDFVRKKASSVAGRLIEATGGFIIGHPDINFKQTALYKDDGINLSEWGLDIWLHGIRDGLTRWLQM